MAALHGQSVPRDVQTGEAGIHLERTRHYCALGLALKASIAQYQRSLARLADLSTSRPTHAVNSYRRGEVRLVITWLGHTSLLYNNTAAATDIFHCVSASGPACWISYVQADLRYVQAGEAD